MGAVLAGFRKLHPIQFFKTNIQTIPTKTIKAKVNLLICFMVCRKKKSPVSGLFIGRLAEAVSYKHEYVKYFFRTNPQLNQ